MSNYQIKSPIDASFFEEFEIFSDFGPTEHFREFNEVSDALLAGYAKIVQRGMPCEMVGLAMLSAMVNLYDMFEMRVDLPELLREAADRVESERSIGHH